MNDASDVIYRNDDAGLRVSKSVPGAANPTLFNWDTQNMTGYAQALEEKTSPSNATMRSYVLGLDVVAQATTDASTTPWALVDWYFVSDGLGSTRALTSDAGTLVAGTEAYNYDAFGNALGGSFVPDTAATSLLFTGEYWDAEKDSYFLRGQPSYEPGIGRFTSFDDFEADRSSPSKLHKYLYGQHNPVYYVDPSGMEGLGGLIVSLGIRVGLYAINLANVAFAYASAYAALYPVTANAFAFGVSVYGLYLYATDREFQDFVNANPNPGGFLAGELKAAYSSARNLFAYARAGNLIREGTAAFSAIRSYAAKTGEISNVSGRTFAAAQVEIDGLQPIVQYANSGGRSVTGTVPVSAAPKFTTTTPGSIPRSTDAEYKMFDNLAANLLPGASGKVTIVIDNAGDPCASCLNVKSQFELMFPGISVNIVYTTPAPTPVIPGMP